MSFSVPELVRLQVYPTGARSTWGDEMSNEGIETARAVRATADAIKEAIGITETAGEFLNRVFGGMIEDSVRIVADRIKFYRS